MDLKAKIVVDSKMTEGFGGFWVGSVKEGEAYIAVNLNALILALASAEGDPETFKFILAETVAHELMHALQEFFDQELEEESIEKALEKAREQMKFGVENG